MKVLISIIMLFSLSSWAQPNAKDLTVYELTKALNASSAQRLPKVIKSVKVENLTLGKNQIKFKAKGFPFLFEIVDSEEVAMRVNGVEFSKADFLTRKTLAKAIVNKFKWKKNRFSALELISDRHPAAIIQVHDSLAQLLVRRGFNVQFCQNEDCRVPTPEENMTWMNNVMNLASTQGVSFLTNFMQAAQQFSTLTPNPNPLPTYRPSRQPIAL
ncbi:MAG: hypothetical protein HRT44_02415 [Bdellovibrionales bacterium]|nr:hypothetical protein [Bdellovibrionales bacterium]NQZ18101.1 hypothetical protein [Bdellovibrionales bacterium]